MGQKKTACVILLLAAAMLDSADGVELLLGFGADPRITDPEGKTAFDWAVQYEAPGVAELLEPATTGN